MVLGRTLRHRSLFISSNSARCPISACATRAKTAGACKDLRRHSIAFITSPSTVSSMEILVSPRKVLGKRFPISNGLPRFYLFLISLLEHRVAGHIRGFHSQVQTVHSPNL